MSVNTLVLGHSFVRHLSDYERLRGVTNLGLNPALVRVTLDGIGGLHVHDMYEAFDLTRGSETF